MDDYHGGFWSPSEEEQSKAQDHFSRACGLMSPDLADVLGVKWALREDTLGSVH